MESLKKFIEISNQDKKLLIKTWLLIWTVKVLLWILPFQKTQKIIDGLASRPPDNYKSDLSLERLIWAVQVTSSYVPGSNCLTNAITGHILLSRENYPNQLRIGVAKDDQGHLEAHAWLESGNRTVIGGSEEEYQTIL